MKPMSSLSQTLPIGGLVQGDEDAGLVLAAQRDPALFAAVYERWVGPIYQYFHFRTGDAPSAEDLTSQLFLSAFQALPRYRHQGHFAAWIFAIARNLAAGFYRQRAREAPLEDAGDGPDGIAPADPQADADRRDEIAALRRAIRALPGEEQELIRLRYAAGLSFADIALVLNRSEDAVKKSTYRLQARLQSLLEQNHE